MRLFILFALVLGLAFSLSACKKRQVEDKQPTSDKQKEAQMENVWGQTELNKFVIAMSEHLAEKARHGDNMSALSEAERIYYVVDMLQMEVSNGGFSQYFYNTAGNSSNELVMALTAIGANKTAAICQKAIDAFGCDIPTDRDERIDLLEKLELGNIDEIFAECDDAFYAYEENLDELSYHFAMKNKDQFN